MARFIVGAHFCGGAGAERGALLIAVAGNLELANGRKFLSEPSDAMKPNLAQRGFIEPLKALAPGAATDAHLAIIQIVEQFANSSIGLRQGKEDFIADPRQYPALHRLYRDFDLGLAGMMTVP